MYHFRGILMKKNIALLMILMASVHFFCHTEPFEFSDRKEHAPSGWVKIRKEYVERQKQRAERQKQRNKPFFLKLAEQ